MRDNTLFSCMAPLSLPTASSVDHAVSMQVLVCTSTLAWGVNFPAHLVVVKGTEFFDGKSQRYVDFPITDLLQVTTLDGCPRLTVGGRSWYNSFCAMFKTASAKIRLFSFEIFYSCSTAELCRYTINSVVDLSFVLPCVRWSYTNKKNIYRLLLQ